MKLGEVKLIRRTCIEKECQNCGEPATKRQTYLYENARRNPASKGYGKDDVSWCSDEEAFVCDTCLPKITTPYDMEKCSTFTKGDRFMHLFLEWKEEEVKEPLASDFMRQFAKEAGSL